MPLSFFMDAIGYFEIQSSNPEREISFYTKVFGWKFERQQGMPIEYYRIITGGISGGLLKRPAPVLPPEYGTNAFTNSVEVASFDKTAAIILQNSGIIALPKFSVPGRCWQGYFMDPDNNIFGIFEVDLSAS